MTQIIVTEITNLEIKKHWSNEKKKVLHINSLPLDLLIVFTKEELEKLKKLLQERTKS